MADSERISISPLTVAGLLFVAVQAAVAFALWGGGTRAIHVTPYSGQTAYRLNVSVAGQPLSNGQIRARYGLAYRGLTQLSPDALQRVIVAREGTQPSAELFVRLHTSHEGRPEEIWLWPQQ
mgnify:FL=1